MIGVNYKPAIWVRIFYLKVLLVSSPNTEIWNIIFGEIRFSPYSFFVISYKCTIPIIKWILIGLSTVGSAYSTKLGKISFLISMFVENAMGNEGVDFWF